VRENTPELWDRLWKREPDAPRGRDAVLREARSVRWGRMERRIVRRFGACGGLRVIELGAGQGTYAALLAGRGAQVTVLDSSRKALERSRRFFRENRLAADHVLADALALGSAWANRFDVSMSFGLAEHFTGRARVRIVRAHLDVLNPGGVAFICVPNRWNPPYRFYKLVCETTGRWPYGEEVPYSRGELAAIMAELGVGVYGFFGDSLPGSLRFVADTPGLRKLPALLGRPRGPARRAPHRARRERGTCLDAYLSYALVLCAVKPRGAPPW